jgi:glycosyltransferase involved in cell wall biosynthesis
MIEKKRQLIFLWTYLQWGGAQIYFLAIIKRALAEWDIVVILPRESSKDLIGFFDDLGVRYEFIDAALDTQPANSLRRKAGRQIRRIRAEIVTLLYLRRFDLRKSILHIETAPWQSWLLLTALSLRGANVFVTLHNYLEGGSAFRRCVWKWRMRFVSRLRGFHIFTSNQDTKDRFRGWFTDTFHNTINVTYTAVNPEQISQAASAYPAEVRKRFSVPPDKFVVICVGQFIDRKGRWVFLEAAKMAAARDAQLTFVWLMPHFPDKADQLRIDEYELGERFMPVLSSSVGGRIDVLKFFKIADVFALPSFVEGLPIALLEAMALGIPSISTNVFAIPEAVRHNETGLLIEAGDSEALANTILRLKEDADLRRSLADKGRKHVLDHFDESVSAETAIRSYEKALADG